MRKHTSSALGRMFLPPCLNRFYLLVVRYPGKVEAAPPVMAVLCAGHCRTPGAPLAPQEGSDPSAPSLPSMHPCGKHALFSFYPVGPAAQAVEYYLTNSICPKIVKKLPHHCQTHFPDSLEYSVHCIGHCLHLWSNKTSWCEMPIGSNMMVRAYPTYTVGFHSALSTHM